MKWNQVKSITLCCLFNAVAIGVCADNEQNGTGETDGYRLVWQDLFDDGVLNEDENWTVEINGNGNGNNELQYYRRENVSVDVEPESGCKCLVLTARKEDYQGKSVTSGRLTTQHKMSFKHGKIEARIKLPKTANGLWPAFWLLGNTYETEGWPRCGEIDILEMGNANGIRNNTQDRYFNGACHWGFYRDGGYPNYAKASTSSYSLQDDFHLFTLIWDEEKVAMYLDKDKYPDVAPYYEMGLTEYADEWGTGNYFHRNFFVIFNLAVGGDFTGIWDIDKVTALENGEAKMYVDYVQVYQKDNEDSDFSWGGNASGLDKELISASENRPELTYTSSERRVEVSGEVEQLTVYTLDGGLVRGVRNQNWIQLPLAFGLSGIYVCRINLKGGQQFAYKLTF